MELSYATNPHSLFRKYASEIQRLTNTEAGRYLIGIKDGFPIIRVTPNSYHQAIDVRNGLLVIRATIFSYDGIAALFLPTFTKRDIALQYRPTQRVILENPYEAFLHFSGLEEKRRKYPQIYLDSSGDLFTSSDASINGGDSASWATAHDATSGTVSTTDPFYIYARLFTDYNVVRGFYNYSLASIAASNTVTDTTHSLYGESKGTDVNSHTFNTFSSTAADPPVSGDFDLVGTTGYSTAISMASWSTTGYNAYIFNSTGITAVQDALAGTLKLSFRDASHDAANVAPQSDANTFVGVFATAQAGTTKDPKVVVTYTVPGGVSGYKSLLGVGQG